jgi:hypothetical protein
MAMKKSTSARTASPAPGSAGALCWIVAAGALGISLAAGTALSQNANQDQPAATDSKQDSQLYHTGAQVFMSAR